MTVEAAQFPSEILDNILPNQYLFTRDQFHQLWNAGILDRNRRYELLCGVILDRDSEPPCEDNFPIFERLRDDWPRLVYFTAEQYERMLVAGILSPDGRYEIIGGVIFTKMGQKPAHRNSRQRTRDFLAHAFGLAHVQYQDEMPVPAGLSAWSRPEPDLSVTREPYDAYAGRYARPEDMLLIIEIADSSLDTDEREKALLYAKTGIEEYWVVNVVTRSLVVFRHAGEFGYKETRRYSEEETIAPIAVPEAEVRVGDLLPPSQEAGD
jgi:Uma2 family endonuclease